MRIEKDVPALAALERRDGPLTFGRMLRALRQCEAESLAIFAARLGVTKQHLSDIERGKRAVSVERAAAWARTLGYHAGQFVALALQAQVEAAGLRFRVAVEPAERRRRAS